MPALDATGTCDRRLCGGRLTESRRPLQETDAAYYDNVISIMQRSFFLAIRYAGQGMSVLSAEKMKPAGSIVVTSSMAGSSGGVADISYCTLLGSVRQRMT